MTKLSIITFFIKLQIYSLHITLGNILTFSNDAFCQVDVCFLLDCTGSMRPWMKAVKDNILKWSCRLHEKYTDAQLRFAFVRYTDFDQPEATRTTLMDFTR